MNIYRAYGLTLACDRELPFTACEAGTPDVTILVDLGHPLGPSRPGLHRELRRQDRDWSLRYRNAEGGWLHFSHDTDDKTLTVAGSVPWKAAVQVLVGVACAVLLSSAGTPLLHGAGVAVGDEAIAILGPSGAGKSTLAAALLKAGGRLLSEDLLALEETNQGFRVHPGHSGISLLPDAFEGLGFASGIGSAAGVRSGTGKSWTDTRGAAATAEPVALRAVYVLEGPNPGFPAGRAERLSRTAASPVLFQHLYGAEWIRSPERADLAFCASLAAKVPIFSLSRAMSLDDLKACAAILAVPQPASVGPG